jgi:hypothetical protein
MPPKLRAVLQRRTICEVWPYASGGRPHGLKIRALSAIASLMVKEILDE